MVQIDIFFITMVKDTQSEYFLKKGNAIGEVIFKFILPEWDQKNS